MEKPKEALTRAFRVVASFFSTHTPLPPTPPRPPVFLFSSERPFARSSEEQRVLVVLSISCRIHEIHRRRLRLCAELDRLIYMQRVFQYARGRNSERKVLTARIFHGIGISLGNVRCRSRSSSPERDPFEPSSGISRNRCRNEPWTVVHRFGESFRS